MQIAALAAVPVRFWSNQKPSQQMEVERVIDWPPSWTGAKGARDLCLWVLQWMTLVFSGAQGMRSKAAISLREFAYRMGRQLSQRSHPHTISERTCHRGYGGELRR